MILLIAATSLEIQPTIDWIEKQGLSSKITILISGIGTPATMYSTMKTIVSQQPELIIQAGIAGSFNTSIKIGDVVIAKSEQWCDLGIEDHEQFRTIFDMHFTNPNAQPYDCGEIQCNSPDIKSIKNLQKVKAITTNTTHGNRISIEKIVQKFNPHIESMEGAAVAYICAMEHIHFLEIRSISNLVEPRNKKAWNISLAIENLNKELQKIINEITL